MMETKHTRARCVSQLVIPYPTTTITTAGLAVVAVASIGCVTGGFGLFGQKDGGKALFYVGGEGSGHHYFRGLNAENTVVSIDAVEGCDEYGDSIAGGNEVATKGCLTAWGKTSSPATYLNLNGEGESEMSYPQHDKGNPDAANLAKWAADVGMSLRVILMVRNYGDMLMSNLRRFHDMNDEYREVGTFNSVLLVCPFMFLLETVYVKIEAAGGSFTL